MDTFLTLVVLGIISQWNIVEADEDARLLRISRGVPVERILLVRVRKQVHHHHHSDEDNLERLCRDPFHSFLCEPLGRQRQRITGKLRAEAVIPPGVLAESSNLRESRLLSGENKQMGYNYPKPGVTFEEVPVRTTTYPTGVTLSTSKPTSTAPSMAPTTVTTKPTLVPINVTTTAGSIEEGYKYIKPKTEFREEPSESKESNGYLYPSQTQQQQGTPSSTTPFFVTTATGIIDKSSQSVSIGREDVTQKPSTSGYSYFKPTGNQFTLPTTTKLPSISTFPASEIKPEGYFYRKPETQFTLPTTSTTRPSPEQLMEDPKIDVRFGAESFQRNIQSPFPVNTKNNLVLLERKDGNDNLDRLCNDPFHSFLCTPIKQKRTRIDGRIRPQAKLPSGFLVGANSFQREVITSPLSENIRGAQSTHNDGYSYSKLQAGRISPVFAASNSPQNGYHYDRPSVPFPEFQPSVKPPIDSGSSNQQNFTQNNGYRYERPKIPFSLPTSTKKPEVSSEQSPLRTTTAQTERNNQESTSSQTESIETIGTNATQLVTAPTSSITEVTSRTSSSTSSTIDDIPSLTSKTSTQLPLEGRRIDEGYFYPKPSVPFPPPQKPTQTTDFSSVPPSQSRPSSTLPSERPSTGYHYERPSKPFSLPVLMPQPTMERRTSQASRLGMLLSNYNRPLKKSVNGYSENLPLSPRNQFDILR